MSVAFVRRDEVEIMFAWPNAHMPFERPLLTGALYIRCDDVDEALSWSMPASPRAARIKRGVGQIASITRLLTVFFITDILSSI